MATDTMKVEPSDYYDRIYRRMAQKSNTLGWQWLRKRVDRVAPLIVGDSVLDLGCGLAEIASHIGNASYVGVDFSQPAIDWSIENVDNPFAVLWKEDLYSFQPSRRFDTVLMLEVLEHIAHPQRLVDKALEVADKRIIVTVPVNWHGRGHYKPSWTKDELSEMLNGFTHIERFSWRWWLAVKDV